MGYRLIRFASAEELAKQAAADWLGELAGGMSADAPPYLVALSGGRVTKTFYEELVRQVKESKGEYEGVFTKWNVHFFWADERCVPPGDPESNYRLAKENLFEPLKVPDGQIHRVRGEAAEANALGEVIGELQVLRPFAAGGQPALDMIFLGMGEDGHTASLFPGEAKEVMEEPAVYRAVTAVKPPPRRITLGYGAIAAAVDCWVLASGAGKEAALKASLSPEGKTPLGRVLRQRTGSRIYTDVAGI